MEELNRCCYGAGAFYCIQCESVDVQVAANLRQLDIELALDDAVWHLQHPDWETTCALSSG